MVNYKLSIVTPVYNNISDTKEYLKQIKNYTHSDYQLVIIDNGSNDGTIDLLDAQNDDASNIKVIKNK